jgi:hypothetical protein
VKIARLLLETVIASVAASVASIVAILFTSNH